MYKAYAALHLQFAWSFIADMANARIFVIELLGCFNDEVPVRFHET